MYNRILFLTKSKFLRNIIIMISGTAFAQIIYFLLSPIITRIYGPEEFGILGSFMALISILGPIAALTYPIAIVLPKEDKEAKGLAKLALIISLLTSLFFVIVILTTFDVIVRYIDFNDSQYFLLLIPIVIFLSGLLQIYENWLIRTKQFKVTAKIAVIQAIFVQGTMVFIGIIHPYASALIIITVVGFIFKVFLMNRLSQKNVSLFERSAIPNISLKKLAFKYKDFPFLRSPEVLISAISQSLPILLLTSFFGAASVGFYTIARSVLNLPTQLIGKSVGDVFYPRIAEAAENKEDISYLIKKATFYLGLLGIIPYSVIVFWGPDIFAIVFGDSWQRSGEYSQWLALWAFFFFLNKPTMVALPVLKLQVFLLYYTIMMLIVRVISLLIGFYYFDDDLIAIALFSTTGAVMNILLIILTLRIAIKRRTPIKD